MSHFYVATDKEIKSGKTTDIYFLRVEEILKKKQMDKVNVVAEITTKGFPNNWEWGVLCGLEEEAHLLEGLPINVYAMPEGTIFRAHDFRGVQVPVFIIEGPYSKFLTFETAVLGLLCQASGVSTAAARIRKAAGKKIVMSFGIRRMHPAISPMIDRAAFVGGVDSVSCVLAAQRLGLEPSGTMPHSLIIMFSDQVEAWRAFDELMSESVPRIALVDTYFDEKIEAIMAADALDKRLWGIRLDTPGSRRGNFEEIIREVKWELNIRGYEHVKIFVSGGLNEKKVKALSAAGASGFGVGTYISNAPTVDFAMDIVEKEGKPVAKRGKYGGKKNLWRCQECMTDVALLVNKPQPMCPRCGKETENILKPLLLNGKLVGKLLDAKEVRNHVLSQLQRVMLEI